MESKNRVKKNSFKKNNVAGELPLKLHLSPGVESRVNFRGKSFFSQIKDIARQNNNFGNNTGPLRGRGTAYAEPKIYGHRVIIKSRVVRTKGVGQKSLMEHLKYIQREGVGIDGTEPNVFTKDSDLSCQEVCNLTEEWGKDRHHFRFIISPEMARELDLKQYTRDLIKKMEDVLRTPLQWVAVAHHNTESPHVHMTIRGRDKYDADLVINGRYMSHGMRSVAETLATRELGYINEIDIQKNLFKTLHKDRLTPLDRYLDQDAAASGNRLLDLRHEPPAGLESAVKNRNNRIARLKHLAELGLAEKVQENVWVVDEKLIEKLKAMGVKNDIVKMMHRRMQGLGFEQDVNLIRPDSFVNNSVVGQVIHTGLSDELYDIRYMLVKSSDGKIHHSIMPSKGKVSNDLNIGDTVIIRGKTESSVTKVDLNLSDFTKSTGGVYNANTHTKYASANVKLPEGVSPREYVANHIKRLNSLARMGLADMLPDGNWRIPSDLIKQLGGKRRNYLSMEITSRQRAMDLTLFH